MNKKLTRAEANSELALRINFEPKCIHCINNTQHTGEHLFVWTNFFTSREAVAELVMRIEDDTRLAVRFIDALAGYLGPIRNTAKWYGMPFYWLRATPEQITLAACVALGIETE